jgi:hypothetical protein
MDSINKILGAFALLAITLAAGIYIVRNGPAIDFKQPAPSTAEKPAPSTPEKPATVTASAPVKPTPVVEVASNPTPTEAGFEPLFNGRDLTGWTGSKSRYSVEGGSLVYGGPGKGNIYTTREYANFHLRFDYKLTAGADNGIGIRTPQTGNPAVVGMEIQLLDESGKHSGDIAPVQTNGSICGNVVAKQGAQKPVGEWNNEDIIARGRHITVILNGQVVLDADSFDGVTATTIDNRPHPGLARPSGHIALMGDTPRVEFRNIRLRELGDH